MKRYIRCFLSYLLITVLAISSATTVAMAGVYPEESVVESTEQVFTCDNQEVQQLLKDFTDEHSKITLMKVLATPAYFEYSNDGMTCDQVKIFAETIKLLKMP